MTSMKVPALEKGICALLTSWSIATFRNYFHVVLKLAKPWNTGARMGKSCWTSQRVWGASLFLLLHLHLLQLLSQSVSSCLHHNQIHNHQLSTSLFSFPFTHTFNPCLLNLYLHRVPRYQATEAARCLSPSEIPTSAAARAESPTCRPARDGQPQSTTRPRRTCCPPRPGS